jgi:hypothetical protein
MNCLTCSRFDVHAKRTKTSYCQSSVRSTSKAHENAGWRTDKSSIDFHEIQASNTLPLIVQLGSACVLQSAEGFRLNGTGLLGQFNSTAPKAQGVFFNTGPAQAVLPPIPEKERCSLLQELTRCKLLQ